MQSKESQPTSDDKEHPPHFICQCKAEKPDQENETYQQQKTTIEFEKDLNQSKICPQEFQP